MSEEQHYHARETTTARDWIVPIAIVATIVAFLYLGIYFLDFFVVKNRGANLGAWELFVNATPNDADGMIGGMAEVVAAILGIIITVASIIVQLAATRYTPRITEMFFRDRTNLSVIAYFIVVAVYCLWVTFSIRHGEGATGKHFVPVYGVLLNTIMISGALMLMAPYFIYVFNFLQPENVVQRIQEQTIARAIGAAKGRGDLAERQERALDGIEQLADVALNTVENKDKLIASRSVDSLQELCTAYLENKKDLPPDWFRIGRLIKVNPDFVAMSEERLDFMSKQRTWFEYKVLRQYQMIYNEALKAMRDINYLVAIDTRYIGAVAIKCEDREVLNLCIKFFNTFMRATLNGRDVRTAYNILNQYRLLGEEVIKGNLDDVAAEVGDYFKYYGQVAFAMKLSFVTETVAYDLSELVELAHREKSQSLEKLLKILLEVDKEAEAEVQETSLRGVRKAQIKLATYFLLKEEEELARQIYLDMKDERPDRLRSIRAELLAIDSKDFWEIIDRGENFDYMEPERKEQLHTFFGWFPKEKGIQEVSAVAEA